jgi:acetyl-CoA acetyltransferase
VPISLAFGRFIDEESPVLFARALRALLDKAGLKKEEIDGLAVSSFSLSPDPAIALSRSLGMSLRWFQDISLGGASGGVSLNRAARAIQAGDASIVACIAADTNPKTGFKDLVANFSRASRDGVYPYGAGGPTSVFALLTQQYMEKYDVGREHFGALCVAQRQNAKNVSHAVFRDPYSIEDYLNARMLADPLCLLDCVMPVAGAEAFLVMSEDRAKALKLPFARVLGAIEHHNAYAEDHQPLRGGWRHGVDQLFEQAGIGHDDIDLIQTYDDYPVISVLQMEELGFFPVGEGARLLCSNTPDVQKRLYNHNTSGGQLSCGQAGAAGGFLGLVEAIRQLTGQAEGWQRDAARHALVSGYGMVIYDRCLATCATIMAAGDE